MGTLAFIDAVVVVNSVDLSDHVTSVELPIEYEELENTAMGQTGKTRQAGLQDSSLKISWNQDFAASKVDATLWAARGTTVAVTVQPTSDTTSATNPEYAGSYLVSKYSPFGNKVGELATVETEWPLSDADGIARNTS